MQAHPSVLSRRRLLWRAAGSFGALALLSACGAAAAPSAGTTTATRSTASAATSAAAVALSTAATSQPSGKAATLQWMVWGDNWSNQVEKEATDVWVKANPGSSIEILNKGGNHFQTLLTMVAGGTPPDTSLVDGYNEPEIISRGAVVNLSPYAAKSGIVQSDYDANMWNENSCGGNLYSFPNMRCYNVVVYYNKDLFQKAGVPFPDQAWTWDDFLSSCHKLTVTQGGKRVQWGVLRTGYWWPFVWMAGGHMYANDQMTQVALDQPAALK